MIPSDNPLRDFERYDRLQSAWLRRRPRCCACRERIQDDICWQDDHEQTYCCGCVAREELLDVYPVFTDELLLEAAV